MQLPQCTVGTANQPEHTVIFHRVDARTIVIQMMTAWMCQLCQHHCVHCLSSFKYSFHLTGP